MVSCVTSADTSWLPSFIPSNHVLMLHRKWPSPPWCINRLPNGIFSVSIPGVILLHVVLDMTFGSGAELHWSHTTLDPNQIPSTPQSSRCLSPQGTPLAQANSLSLHKIYFACRVNIPCGHILSSSCRSTSQPLWYIQPALNLDLIRVQSNWAHYKVPPWNPMLKDS